MSVRTVVPGVFQLPHAASNAYLFDGGDGIALVDTGVAGREQAIGAAIDTLEQLAGRDLAVIAVTHAHLDHAGSLAALADDFGVPVAAGAGDASVIRVGGVVPVGTPTSRVARVLGRLIRARELASARVDVELEDGMTVPGAPALRAIHTPGHTAGHTSFLWDEQGGVLFAGDAAANVLGLREGFVAADRRQAAASVARLAALDFEVAVFGHGPPITGRAVSHFRLLADELARKLAV